MSNAKLLIVDDESDQLDALERALRRDFDVSRALSGLQALERISMAPDVAVVLTDVRMPGMGGLELLAEVRRLAPTATRVAASGAIDVRGMAEAINSGNVDQFVLKPWEPELLRVQMVSALRMHEAAKERGVLERLASTDPLTEIANRRHFDARLQVELERAKRHGRSVAIAMIDVDRFKDLNDRLGHAQGDVCLRRAAQAMALNVRSLDFVARLGGDEFAILMPDSDLRAAVRVAERVRLAVESSALTVSIGVAAFPENGPLGPDDAAGLLRCADQALYRAKGQGRNQTVVAPIAGLVP